MKVDKNNNKANEIILNKQQQSKNLSPSIKRQNFPTLKICDPKNSYIKARGELVTKLSNDPS